jgi:hypothetical protein
MNHMNLSIKKKKRNGINSESDYQLQEGRSNSEIHHDLRFYKTVDADRFKPKVTLRSNVSEKLNRSWQQIDVASSTSNLGQSRPTNQIEVMGK